MRIATSVAATIVALASFAVSSASAQGNPPPPPKKSGMESHHASSSGWKELDHFHELLAATWHPLEHGADFKPVKEKASKLAEAAKEWADSRVPAACDKKPVRDAVAASAVNARAVADLVAKKAPDDELKTAMKKLHDGFEAAEHNCHPK